MTPEYDMEVRKAIMQVQARNGLTVDGLTGPMTKIVLYNAKNSFKTPRLRNRD